MTARLAPFAAAALAIAIGIPAERGLIANDLFTPLNEVLDVAVGVTSVVAGVIAWRARPESVVGPLLVAAGALWWMTSFGSGDDPVLVDLVGFPSQGFTDVLLVVLLLAVSPGGLAGRAARTITAALLATQVCLALTHLLLRPPLDISSCFCLGNRVTGLVDPDPHEVAVRIIFAVQALIAGAALVLLGTRWRTATGPARRTLGVLLAACGATVGLVFVNRVLTRVVTEPAATGQTMTGVIAVVRISVPLAVLWSLLRGRRARERVADVLVRGVDSATLQRAFADPAVRLLRWSNGRYVDEDGAPAELPAPSGPLTATLLERDGTRLGALVHDAALREEPELLEAVAAAARLALHNDALARRAEERLVEVRASRERLVEATDAERRRLERDLHDGAQQRLLGLAFRLRDLERRAGETGDIALADELYALASDLEEAMAQIRSLARGIRPPLLVESGLGAALSALAEGSPVPIEADVRVPRRLPDAVESTAYFAAGEALANVLRHADAGRVRLTAAEHDGRLVVTVADDGVGGAALGDGTGLAGLADRAAALGGSVSVDSPPGAGTTIIVDLPAEPQPVARK
jgi:signal transduction histidine kinase